MRRLAVLALACLAGCAPSSTRVVAQGQAYEFSVPLGPRDLANCIATNSVNYASRYTSSVTELIKPYNYEVVISDPQTRQTAIIVARTSPTTPPAAVGSRLVLFMSLPDLGAGTADDWIARLRKGC